MAAGPSQHTGFSNDEKNFLLAELIKSAAPPHHVLLGVFNQLNTLPRFEDIPLPSGRSMNACRLAFDEMRRGPMYSPLSSTGPAPTPLSAPILQLKRTPGLEGPYSGRALLPKQSGYSYPTNINEPPLKRRRGRPTKAEQQARAAGVAEAVGPPAESSMAHARFNTPQSASLPASPIVEARPSSTIPPNTRVPISAMITPIAPKSASHSSSSSGKRRRRRDAEEQAALREHMDSSARPDYSSYRRPPHPDDTPARAPPSRYREEPIHSSVARLGVSEPEQTAGAYIGMTTGSPQPRRPQLPPPPPQPGR